MLLMASRNRLGIDASASATSFSKCARATAGNRLDAVEVVALALNGALLTQGLGPADAAAVKNQRVGRPRPSIFRHRVAQLSFDDHRVVALRDADAVRHAQHVAIDRQAGYPKRVPEDDIRRLSPDAGKLD